MERIRGRKRDMEPRFAEAHAALDAYLLTLPDDVAVNIEASESPIQPGRERTFMIHVRVLPCTGCGGQT